MVDIIQAPFFYKGGGGDVDKSDLPASNDIASSGVTKRFGA